MPGQDQHTTASTSLAAPGEMRLYHFNPNTYGQQWFVMAASREDAIEAVRASIRADVAKDTWYTDTPEDEWPAGDPRNGKTAEQKRAEALTERLAKLETYVNEVGNDHQTHAPCIEVFGPGQVVWAEIC